MTSSSSHKDIETEIEEVMGGEAFDDEEIKEEAEQEEEVKDIETEIGELMGDEENKEEEKEEIKEPESPQILPC